MRGCVHCGHAWISHTSYSCEGDCRCINYTPRLNAERDQLCGACSHARTRHTPKCSCHVRTDALRVFRFCPCDKFESPHQET